MKITKYEHACLDIVEQGTRILIDPGKFTASLTDLNNISAVVITHIHGDHFSPQIIQGVVQANLDVKIFSTKEVVQKINSNAEVAMLGRRYTVRNFTLEFFGEKHAEIDPQTPVVENIGVFVNNKLYYPGDSFTECPKPFEALAVPASAPWLRVGQTIPLIENSQCKLVFPMHNALLSEIGHATTNNWLQKFAERADKKFTYLKPSESIEV